MSILVRLEANVKVLKKEIICQGRLWKLLLLLPKRTLVFILIVKVTTSHLRVCCSAFEQKLWGVYLKTKTTILSLRGKSLGSSVALLFQVFVVVASSKCFKNILDRRLS